MFWKPSSSPSRLLIVIAFLTLLKDAPLALATIKKDLPKIAHNLEWKEFIGSVIERYSFTLSWSKDENLDAKNQVREVFEWWGARYWIDRVSWEDALDQFLSPLYSWSYELKLILTNWWWYAVVISQDWIQSPQPRVIRKKNVGNISGQENSWNTDQNWTNTIDTNNEEVPLLENLFQEKSFSRDTIIAILEQNRGVDGQIDEKKVYETLFTDQERDIIENLKVTVWWTDYYQWKEDLQQEIVWQLRVFVENPLHTNLNIDFFSSWSAYKQNGESVIPNNIYIKLTSMFSSWQEPDITYTIMTPKIVSQEWDWG